MYPVSALGGVEYMAALKKPFPHIPMVASQGITMGQKAKIICSCSNFVFRSFLNMKVLLNEYPTYYLVTANFIFLT